MTELTAADGQPPRLDPIAARGLSQLLKETIWGETRRGEFTEVWIRTDDPFIASLPWAMAGSPAGGGVLAAQSIPVSVQIGDPVPEAGFGPMPRILVCAPRPGTWGDTQAEDHLAELRTALPGCVLAEVPTTAEQLLTELDRHKPDIFYYYGHADLVGEETFEFVLQVSDDPGAGEDCLPVERFVDLLHEQVRAKLALVYLNCCFGGTAAPGGAPIHLGPLVPALISNRTSALIPAARRQAIEILKRIVQDGFAPHVAVAFEAKDSRSIPELAAVGVASRDEPWWMTPVAYARYRAWQESMQLGPGRFRITERHTLKLARANHVTALALHLGRQRLPPVSLLLWHAASEDGLEPLAERLRSELGMSPKLLPNPVTWPDEGKADLDPQPLRSLLSRLIGAQMREAARVNDDDANGLASVASRKLGPRGGIASIRFAPIPAEIAAERAVIWIGAAADALGNAVGRPIDHVFSSDKARVVALLPVAAADLVTRVPPLFAKAVTSTKWLAQEWLPPLDVVRQDELDVFLRLFMDQSDAFDRDFQAIVWDIYDRCQVRRYEKVRQALHEFEFP